MGVSPQISMFTIFSLIVLLFSIIIHEIAHGSAAFYLGDPTAKYSGRLTLNPLKHLDLFGSILLPLFLLLATAGKGPIFGWAKPVPINPYNLRDKKWGLLKVSIVGPLANFLLAIIFALIIRFLRLPAPLLLPFSLISFLNFLWALFNLVPLPPLDGSHILFSILPEKWNNVKLILSQYGTFILIAFIFLGGGIYWLNIGAGFLFSLFAGSGI